MVLVRGLSPNSVTTTKLHARRYIGQRRGKAVNEVTSPEQAQRAFASLFGPGPGGTSA